MPAVWRHAQSGGPDGRRVPCPTAQRREHFAVRRPGHRQVAAAPVRVPAGPALAVHIRKGCHCGSFLINILKKFPTPKKWSRVKPSADKLFSVFFFELNIHFFKERRGRKF